MFLPTCLLALLPAAEIKPAVVSVAPANGGKLLFVAMSQGRAPAGSGWVYVWDVSKPELKAVISELPPDVRTVQPTADGNRFVLIGGARDSRIEVWDAIEKKRLYTFEVSPRALGQTAVSPDGKWVVYRTVRSSFPPRRAEGGGGIPMVRVWNTDTGNRAEEVEKAIPESGGSLAFTADSKRLVVASRAGYAEFDVTTGKKVVEWVRDPAPTRQNRLPDYGGAVVAIPGIKGAVSVTGTGNRRQSYLITLSTEKKDWHLGEVWDRASPPEISPDGRWLVVRGGSRSEGEAIFILKLNADGSPELMDRDNRTEGPFGGGDGKKVPAWRVLPSGGGGGQNFAIKPPGIIAFSADGKRIFTGAGNELRVFDPASLKHTATVWASEPVKGHFPEWLITTPGGAFAGSPTAEALHAKPGRDRDPAKVKEALGAK